MQRGINIADLSDELTSVKSHDEILQLIKEIEELEQHINQGDLVEFEIVPDSSTMMTDGELSSKIDSEIPVDNLLRPESAAGELKKRGLLLKRRTISKELAGKNRLDSFLHPEPVRNVFVLRLTESGKLVGFDLKKPIQPREKFNIRTMFKRKPKSAEQAGSKEPVKGIKGKLMGITGLFRRKGGGEGGSKAAGAIGKLKGVFSRK